MDWCNDGKKFLHIHVRLKSLIIVLNVRIEYYLFSFFHEISVFEGMKG